MVRSVFFLFIIAACGLVSGCSRPGQKGPAKPLPEVNSFKECVDAGYPVLKSYPPRCVAKNGKIFTNDIVRNIDGRACKDECGNGQCQQIVCQADGCPCAETPVNCARDCADYTF